ncbi:hypothetical protein M8J75_002537 [Diaphorina citri]|nr:hypothetical protein M8J75_002537 [Diaphorina citri]
MASADPMSLLRGLRKFSRIFGLPCAFKFDTFTINFAEFTEISSRVSQDFLLLPASDLDPEISSEYPLN